MPLGGFEFCTYLQTPFGFGFELSNTPSARTGLLRRLANVLHYEAQAVCPITNMEVLSAVCWIHACGAVVGRCMDFVHVHPTDNTGDETPVGLLFVRFVCSCVCF